MAPVHESPSSSKIVFGGTSSSFPASPNLQADANWSSGQERREERGRAIWRRLPLLPADLSLTTIQSFDSGDLTSKRARTLKEIYFTELVKRCRSSSTFVNEEIRHPGWGGFKRYADAKDKDLDEDGHLDASEWLTALEKAEFCNFLMPHTTSTAEYELRKYVGDDDQGPARVNTKGDVSRIKDQPPPNSRPGPNRPEPESSVFLETVPESAFSSINPPSVAPTSQFVESDSSDNELPSHDEHPHNEDEDEGSNGLGGPTALKFLLAGGVAGIVSRTATAPFDRLKVYLITASDSDLHIDVATSNRAATQGVYAVQHTAQRGAKTFVHAITNIYGQGGIKAFWVGNGLNAMKIFPESAIKFMSYETSKRVFAKYVDHVDDPREISGTSRFISGGFGGITSQLGLFTQLMSTTKGNDRSLLPAMRRLWALGGLPAYYRGLVVGLIGVFPYSAIDMSTFEALKLAYARSTGHPEPGVLALLAFGSISGSVGATSVYPLNLVRTRLQASGSSGHPQHYTGIMDVVHKTYACEGWRGFYKGLVPTLAKVVPAVSISYVVYEHTKRTLGVA
ncbi:hypothetical protein BS47DRAFT_1344318 [Hydnum rufescens UP504]|uniref:Uncharacterized protein n=1 Tax=Hydnum rufescens UP504 TaxID=1448309 RepID=A0A9P6AYU2_9AGAM|nr:hypothetical protein BS47DRAFT_1344318 [Hydnum rufescens UP504]